VPSAVLRHAAFSASRLGLAGTIPAPGNELQRVSRIAVSNRAPGQRSRRTRSDQASRGDAEILW